MISFSSTLFFLSNSNHDCSGSIFAKIKAHRRRARVACAFESKRASHAAATPATAAGAAATALCSQYVYSKRRRRYSSSRTHSPCARCISAASCATATRLRTHPCKTSARQRRLRNSSAEQQPRHQSRGRTRRVTGAPRCASVARSHDKAGTGACREQCHEPARSSTRVH